MQATNTNTQKKTTPEQMPTPEWFAALPSERKEKAITGSYAYRFTQGNPEDIAKKLRSHYQGQTDEEGDVIGQQTVGINESMMARTEVSIQKMVEAIPQEHLGTFAEALTADVVWAMRQIANFVAETHPEYIKKAQREYADGVMNYMIDTVIDPKARAAQAAAGARARVTEADSAFTQDNVNRKAKAAYSVTLREATEALHRQRKIDPATHMLFLSENREALWDMVQSEDMVDMAALAKWFRYLVRAEYIAQRVDAVLRWEY